MGARALVCARVFAFFFLLMCVTVSSLGMGVKVWFCARATSGMAEGNVATDAFTSVSL